MSPNYPVIKIEDIIAEPFSKISIGKIKKLESTKDLPLKNVCLGYHSKKINIFSSYYYILNYSSRNHKIFGPVYLSRSIFTYPLCTV